MINEKHLYEQTYIRFSKQCLWVNIKSINTAVKVELSRFPLSGSVTMNIIKYYIYIMDSAGNSLIKLAYNSQVCPSASQKQNFVTTLQKISRVLGINIQNS